MGWFSSKLEWGVFDCLTGAFSRVTVRPFIIGSSPTAVDLQVPSEGNVFPEHMELIVPDEGDAKLNMAVPGATIRVNGDETEAITLQVDTNYLVQAGHSFLLICGRKKIEEWSESLRPDAWVVLGRDGERMQPMSRLEIAQWANTASESSGMWVEPAGLGNNTARIPLLDLTNTEQAVAPEKEIFDVAESEEITPPPDTGPFRCPYCLGRFEEDGPLWIATHELLRTDHVLKGDDGIGQRFQPGPANFTAEGNVKDAMGSICHDYACPHCRLKLPFGFLQTTNHLISIVGDTKAGKSYYLTVMSKKLPETMIKKFGVGFTDMNPEGNVILNDMVNTLFSRSTPEEAQLLKTDLEGFMYRDVSRNGRTAKMPRPFVYKITSPDLTDANSVTFYDNAGEHFQPGQDTEDSPGAQHVGAASGILFLMDPFNSTEFRRIMENECDDPQMEIKISDMHTMMLDEIGARIRRLNNLPPRAPINTPLAIVVGKYDSWRDSFQGCIFGDSLEQALYSCRLRCGEWVIGREGTGQIDLPYEAISRPHARIHLSDDEVKIMDLDSTYGTFVDGNKLPPNQLKVVHPFSKIRLHDMSLDLERNPQSEYPEHPYVLTLYKNRKELDPVILDYNSNKLRTILMDTCPGVVASAESLSSNVCYFPVSTFGHTPVKVDAGYSPDPRKLRPFQVEIPVTWILSELIPGLVPVADANATVVHSR